MRGVPGLAGDQQSAGGLGVGEQKCFLLTDGRQVDMRADPVEVAPRSPADVAGRQRLTSAVQIGNRR
jgi:hypothetical protein